MKRVDLFGVAIAAGFLVVGCEPRQDTHQTAANTNTSTVAQGGAVPEKKVKDDEADSIPAATPPNQPNALEAGAAAPAAPAKTEGPQIYLNSPNQAPTPIAQPPENTENYQIIDDNPVKQVAEAPVSTFSIDVDSGSYANIRRFLMNGQRPPKDAVRVEEMVNYFSYDYPAPREAGIPFKTTTHVVKSPWNADTYLLEIGIKGYEPPKAERPAANLVFLIDVSGSMADPDKLPLLKAGMKLLTDHLTEKDKVSIVVYAGNAGVVLEPTSGKDKDEIADALERLEAGGSTAGGEGIQLAYSLAKKARIDGGINRIILATDGDFNVGVTDIDQLKGMIEESRKLGISLTTLGFGEGNFNDALMEQLADVGNGNYGYIDSLKEAKRLLVDQLDATIQTIAKDVKIQIEFNPSVVAQYRLIGYENRALRREDFNNDKKDAGEIGAGHTVTAIYEIALVGSKGLAVDPLRYGASQPTETAVPPIKPSEFAFLRLRYKEPEGDTSKLIETPLRTEQLNDPTPAPADLDFAAAVAAFGQLLRGGDYLGKFSYDQIVDLARQARGPDDGGYRAEFIDLVEMAKSLGDS